MRQIKESMRVKIATLRIADSRRNLQSRLMRRLIRSELVDHAEASARAACLMRRAARVRAILAQVGGNGRQDGVTPDADKEARFQLVVEACAESSGEGDIRS